MANRILLILCFLVFVSTFAQNPEEVFNSANRMYQQKEFDKAIELYQELVDNGYEGVSLYFNLGNAYYRAGKLGYAILDYEKSLKLSPGDEDIIHNLTLANSRTVDKLTEFPSFFLFKWWEDLLGVLTLTGWVYVVYLFFILTLLFIAGYLLLKNPVYQKYSFFSAIITGIIFISSVVVVSVRLNRDVNTKNGILVENTVNVKTSPEFSSNDAFVIHEGIKLKLEEAVGEWIKIRLNDGKTGWIPEENVRII
jgi:tetratricopeptide (TPR) repeat protein